MRPMVLSFPVQARGEPYRDHVERHFRSPFTVLGSFVQAEGPISVGSPPVAGIVPALAKAWAVTFPQSMDLETASRHTVAGTWTARLRAVLPLGHAGTDRPTGQRETENDCPLDWHPRRRKGGKSFTMRGCTQAQPASPVRIGWQNAADGKAQARATGANSEDSGFLFLSLFRAAYERKGVAYGPTSFWGVFLFSPCLSLLRLPLRGLLRAYGT
jgi:hypothetical protein